MKRCLTLPLRRIRAFTLIELLVVISIIALLVSILLPALSKARDSAVAIQCSSVLRSVRQALAMYGADNNQWSPDYTSIWDSGAGAFVQKWGGSNTGHGNTAGYMNKLAAFDYMPVGWSPTQSNNIRDNGALAGLACPEDIAKSLQNHAGLNGRVPFSYWGPVWGGGNASVVRGGFGFHPFLSPKTVRNMRMDQIPNPTEYFLLIEMNASEVNAFAPGAIAHQASTQIAFGSSTIVSDQNIDIGSDQWEFNHDVKNIAFGDGHVEGWTIGQLQTDATNDNWLGDPTIAWETTISQWSQTGSSWSQ